MSTKELQIEKGQMSLLNALPSAAAILNGAGDVVITNREWDQNCSSGFFFKTDKNTNFFEHCSKAAEQGSDDALKLIIGLRKILDREQDFFESTYSNKKTEDNEWYKVNLRSFENTGAILFIEDITDNVSAIRELRDSQEKYRQQFDHSINGIIIGTPTGEIYDANPAACKILGYTHQELIDGGRGLVLDLTHPLNKEAAEIREKKSFFEGEKQYIHKSGREISVMVSSVLFRDKDRGLTTINSFRDITKEKQIQKKLKNEQEFARTAIASIPGTFYVLDTDGTFLQWNEAFFNDLGYSQQDMFGLKPIDFFVEEDQELVSEKLNEALKEGAAETVARVKAKNGDVRVFKLNARSFKNENATYIVGTGMDITELVDAKSASDRHFQMMSQLFENAPIGIVMINQENKIIRINEGFNKLFGFKNGDVIGTNLNDLITKADTREEAEKAAVDAFDGALSQFESVRYTKNGEKVPVLVSTVPISEEGKVTAAYGIYVDLTPQKELEERITDLLCREREAREKAQNSLKEKEILLQEVHHRVKNNLAVIAGLLDLQLLEETDKEVFKKLSEVQSRIFSIAKIHETLYQEKNVVHIRFNSYLKSFINFLPQQGFTNEIISELNLNCDETVLNLNQAVPAGLMINELINVLLPESGKGNLMLDLKSDDKSVTISLCGAGLRVQNFKENLASEKFQYKLVDILVAQLDGTIDVDVDREMVIVSFSKNESKGSSNAFFS
ncbi:PAS domain S-box protein [Rhodohalobacter sp. SW132]|uniref:PAS domain S-box protein n=1 Tax=Rhodohalobacter sp. SW132 TaxID=2293433 RepID=UPI000E227B25|nr:PAS domain S-box protein [Rhodohalobacter sp. SW132]REL24959.1 PAS domain S-box protein [Rhodohalobacter sp. SW132]